MEAAYKEAVKQYLGIEWNHWVWACKVAKSDPMIDAIHEYFEFKAVEKICGEKKSMNDLLKEGEKAELIVAAAHAIACLMTHNLLGDAYCKAQEWPPPSKCRYCCIKR